MKTTILNRFPLAFLLLGMLMTIVSCSKDSKLPHGADEPTAALSISLDYEDIGERHNAVLDAIGNAEDFSETNASGSISDLAAYFAKIIKTTTECVDCNESDMADLASTSLTAVAAFEDVAGAADHYHAAGGINTADKAQLYLLNDIVYSSSSMSGAAVQTALLNFEDAAASNGDLSENGRVTILGSSAVMRYSDAYWRNVQSTPSHPWHEIEGDRDDASPGLVWWVKDILGALCAIQSEDWSSMEGGEYVGAVMRVVSAAACASFGG